MKINNKKVLFLVIWVTIFSPLFANSNTNEVKISGHIYDHKNELPLLGVTVFIGASSGTVSDENGYYEIFIPTEGKQKVRYSKVGYATVEKTVFLTKGRDLTQDIYMKTNPIFLSEFVVTGTRIARTLDDAPIHTKVILKEDIKEMGAATALEVLEGFVPGVQFNPDPHGANIQIQGLDNDYVLILIDGERMVGETRGNVNFDRINVADIERVEIVSGASSVLYGSNAIGGVINIITKSRKEESTASIRSRYGSLNAFNNSFSATVTEGNLTLKGHGFRNSNDGFVIKEGGKTKYKTLKYLDNSGGAEASYKISPEVTIFGRFNCYDHELKEPALLKSQANKQRNLSYNGGLSMKINNENSLEFKANKDRFGAYRTLDKDGGLIEKKSDYSYNTIAIQETYSSDNLEVVSGVDFNYESIYSLILFSENNRNQSNYDINLFTQGSYRLLDDLELVAGLRYCQYQREWRRLTPMFSAKYKWQRFKFRAGAAMGYKAPSLMDMYYDFDHFGMFWIYGNPNLKPEKSNYLSISSEYSYADLNIEVNTYRNFIEDKIEIYDVKDAATGRLELHHRNIAEALLQGVEGNINYQPCSFLKLRLGYVLSFAVNNKTKGQITGNSKHTGTTAITLQMKKIKTPIALTFSGRAASPKEYYVRTAGATPLNDGTQEYDLKKTKPYSLWNISYLQTIPLYKKFSVEVQCGVNNIFDYYDLQYYSLVNPGRTFFFGLNLNI